MHHVGRRGGIEPSSDLWLELFRTEGPSLLCHNMGVAFFGFFFFLVVLRLEPRTLLMLGENFVTELYPCP
jgi:hypothetical protein